MLMPQASKSIRRMAAPPFVIVTRPRVIITTASLQFSLSLEECFHLARKTVPTRNLCCFEIAQFVILELQLNVCCRLLLHGVRPFRVSGRWDFSPEKRGEMDPRGGDSV